MALKWANCFCSEERKNNCLCVYHSTLTHAHRTGTSKGPQITLADHASLLFLISNFQTAKTLFSIFKIVKFSN